MKLGKHAFIGIGAVAALGIAMPGFAGGNKYSSTEVTRTCSDMTGDYGTVVLDGPLKLWPPNHKMIDEPVTATAKNPSDNVDLTLTPEITDATGGDGGPQHDPDFNTNSSDGKSLEAMGTGSATAALQLRAERSGKGDGRTYTINWTATFGMKKCSSTDSGQSPFVITVPHDMSGGAGWKP